MNSYVEIRFGPDTADFAKVHAWLTESYWSPGISRERVERAARHSARVVNAFADGRQIGYARLISDETTFAYLCDVYVDESARGRGVARTMVAALLADPELQGLRRWLLATKDAHGVYAPLGFISLPMTERWMVRLG